MPGSVNCPLRVTVSFSNALDSDSCKSAEVNSGATFETGTLADARAELAILVGHRGIDREAARLSAGRIVQVQCGEQ